MHGSCDLGRLYKYDVDLHLLEGPTTWDRWLEKKTYSGGILDCLEKAKISAEHWIGETRRL